jgi:serine/threonine protein phosphatase PrpC
MAFKNKKVNFFPNSSTYLQTFRENEKEKIEKLEKTEKAEKISSRDITPDKQNINSSREKFFNFRKKLNFTTTQTSRTKAGRTYLGKTKINQDSYLVRTKIFNLENFNIYGVFDGHGMNGHHVSNMVRNFLANYFTKLENFIKLKKVISPDDIYQKLKEDNYKMIKDAIITAEIELKKSHFDVNFSGTTCILVLIIDDKIICANCGDSRAIMTTDKKTQVVQLSRDHKPELKDEKQRILASNGWVEKYNQNGYFLGPYRVFVKNEYYPGLAMSRSIGDFVATSVGVISEPEITEFSITENTKYILLGSDGVFEFLNNEKISDTVSGFYSMNNIEAAADKVLDEAVKSWGNVKYILFFRQMILWMI